MRSDLHTPWSDECKLVRFTSTKDAQGYEKLTPHRHRVICTWEDGVSQSEFYTSHKAGFQASASVEVWRADMRAAWPRKYTGERFVDFHGRRYRVIRDFPSGFDLQTLILSEVIR